MTTIRLFWHDYDYFPYEKDLALREVNALLAPSSIEEGRGEVVAHDCERPEAAIDLVYFRAFSLVAADRLVEPTRQRTLEATAERSPKRQPTRYSTHGLHEYKGKFNPQTAQALLNLSGVRRGGAVLDPYCGSGTTLIEAMQRGSVGLGIDANPLAVFLTETKALALSTPVRALSAQIKRILEAAGRLQSNQVDGERQEYLLSWLPPETYRTVEGLHMAAENEPGVGGAVLKLLVSDLLRDYSLQEPQDLRVRRRRSDFPKTALLAEISNRIEAFTERLAAAQSAITCPMGRVVTALADTSALRSMPAQFAGIDVQAVITSPPYAMALPYIDTQRISLVWLGLAEPGQLRPLEAQLTGSREIGTRERASWNRQLAENTAALPFTEHALCIEMLQALGDSDGFRRESVPALLYRYFDRMSGMYRSVRTLVCEGTPYFLVVGHNSSTLGGRKFEIDTPDHLASLGGANGWSVEEVVPLQTYRRFGLHSRNAVAAESLIHLKAK